MYGTGAKIMFSLIPNTAPYCRKLRRFMNDELEGEWLEAVIRN